MTNGIPTEIVILPSLICYTIFNIFKDSLYHNAIKRLAPNCNCAMILKSIKRDTHPEFDDISSKIDWSNYKSYFYKKALIISFVKNLLNLK